MTRRLVAALLVSLAFPLTLQAQAADSSAARAERFVAEARKATERFKDISVAVSESYLKVGPDFPAMGEHWVNSELIMRSELNPARPAILTYATIDGKPTLTGAVYALALRPGEQPPQLPGNVQWHDHVGTIDEESLLFGHDMHAASDELRLVVMHAWIWVGNPDGMFVTDNWALPLARLGVANADRVPVGAARALALVPDSARYHEKLFASAGGLDAREIATVSAIIADRRKAVGEWWTRRASVSALTAADADWLGAQWNRLRADVNAKIRPAAAERLQRVFGHH
jgi:hypothetical protein